MAIGIQNYPNIDTTDPTNFPNGRIKDDPAGVVGTPLKESTIGDIHQFFAKILRLTSTSPNNLPEDEGNGFQYLKSLMNIIFPPFERLGFQTDISNTWANVAGSFNNAAFQILSAPGGLFSLAPASVVNLCGQVHISALGGSGTSPIFQATLIAPVSKKVQMGAMASIGGTLTPVTLTMDTTGLLTLNVTSTAACTV